MKITNLRPTRTLVMMGGQTLRAWQGEAEGVEVTVLVARIIISDPLPRRWNDYEQPNRLEIITDHDQPVLEINAEISFEAPEA
jgi:hypothetical protein